jgi:hypothetical protein
MDETGAKLTVLGQVLATGLASLVQVMLTGGDVELTVPVRVPVAKLVPFIAFRVKSFSTPLIFMVLVIAGLMATV